MSNNLEFFPEIEIQQNDLETTTLVDNIRKFDDFGTQTQVYAIHVGKQPVPVYVNEFWTSKQRAAHSLHEVSYRACFKPQLPRFFIDRLTREGDAVLDPFMGRGTTPVEAALAGRTAIGCDINPLSAIMCAPRLTPPTLAEVETRLDELDLSTYDGELPYDLRAFYEENTLRELFALRQHFLDQPELDSVDAWIRMVATNRLTGHSKGFFSVYTLPPNQAVSAERQRRINEKRQQTPEYRDVKKIILKKSKTLLKDLTEDDRATLTQHGPDGTLIVGPSDKLKGLKKESVSLVVTSPPFLDVVDYAGDNWLRCWFNGIDPHAIDISIFRNVTAWSQAMTRSFKRMHHVLKKGGYVAFEVGEIRNGKIKLEEHVIPAAERAGLVPILVLINDQEFTKTSNCWGISNLQKGTNTNRIVLLRKP